MELAQQMIEKELEFDKTITSTVIHELISLYSRAMEHYERNDNPKYLDFQERMHKMLIKPQVLSILKQKNCTSDMQETVPLPPSSEAHPGDLPQVYGLDELSVRKQQADLTRKELSSRLNKNLFKHKAQKNFSMMIERHRDFTRDIANKAVADFKSQDSSLEMRLASRKKKQYLSRSMSLGSSDMSDINTFACDLSDIYEEQNTSTKSSLFTIEEHTHDYESFENKLEDIMEKNFGERAMKVAEIKMKYQNQINEFSGMGEMMNMLVEQMRKNMQEDIESVMVEYDLKRKQEIRKLKEELYH